MLVAHDLLSWQAFTPAKKALSLSSEQSLLRGRDRQDTSLTPSRPRVFFDSPPSILSFRTRFLRCLSCSSADGSLRLGPRDGREVHGVHVEPQPGKSPTPKSGKRACFLLCI